MFLKNKNIIFKIRRSKVTDYAALKGGYTGSSESTHVKMQHCWKSHVMAQFIWLKVYNSSCFYFPFRISGADIQSDDTYVGYSRRLLLLERVPVLSY